MTNEIKEEVKVVDPTPENTPKDPVDSEVGTSMSLPKILVTSTKTVDFPAFAWGIHEGETCELPNDQTQQKEILSKDFIKLVK